MGADCTVFGKGENRAEVQYSINIEVEPQEAVRRATGWCVALHTSLRLKGKTVLTPSRFLWARGQEPLPSPLMARWRPTGDNWLR